MGGHPGAGRHAAGGDGNKLNTELNAVLNDPAVRERLATLGIDPTPGTPEQFRQQMQKDLAAYGPIVKGAGIKLE